MALWLSFALIGVGILAIGIEIFVPAAGLIGLAGGGSIVAGVVIGFVEHDPMTGSIVLFTALLATPTVVLIGLRAFPKTRVGRQLILGDVDESGVGAESVPVAPSDPRVAGAVAAGDEGEALTVLRPSGTALVGGRRISVVTSGEWVERGARLRVVRVEGNRVVVRATVDLSGS